MNCITKGMTPLGDPCIRIDPLALSQEEVKAMLPYLQSFAETGSLEPQSPLQGGSLLEESIEKRIKAFCDLVKEWRILLADWKEFQDAEKHKLWKECRDTLLLKTAQLLGEE